MSEKESAETKVVPLKARRCPNCGKAEVVEFSPFCCRRCSDLDLGRWLNEDYRIATDEKASADGEPPEEA